MKLDGSLAWEEVRSEERSEEALAWSSGDLKDPVEPSRFMRVLGCGGSACACQSY